MAFNPPVVGNGIAQAALNAAADLPGGPANVRVTRSAKRRKVADALLATGNITEAEYGDHEGFHARCVEDVIAAGGGSPAGGGPPAWFAPAMAAALAPINANLLNINARQANAVAVQQDDNLAPLSNVAGIADPNFPATLQDLNNLTGPQLTAILEHYGVVPPGAVEARRDRFKKYIGIRL